MCCVSRRDVARFAVYLGRAALVCRSLCELRVGVVVGMMIGCWLRDDVVVPCDACMNWR